MDFLVVHAPNAWAPKCVHPKEHAKHVASFWWDLERAVIAKRTNAPIVVTMDANARTGHIVSEMSGDRAACTSCYDIEAAFASFCDAVEVILPATFDQYHRGADHT